MLIHRVDEGERLYFGLNWLSNKTTFFGFKFVIPFFVLSYKNYYAFDTDNFYSGLRCNVIYFSFHIRRGKNFSPKTKIFICHCSLGTRALGKQQLVATRESLLSIRSQEINNG